MTVNNFGTSILVALPCSHLSLSQSTLMEHWLASRELDTRDVVTAVEDFLLAGVHTSAYAASFLLYNMASNPKVQDR